MAEARELEAQRQVRVEGQGATGRSARGPSVLPRPKNKGLHGVYPALPGLRALSVWLSLFCYKMGANWEPISEAESETLWESPWHELLSP